MSSTIPAGMPGFADLGVPSALVAVLTGQGITEPFPIQTATLPDALAGRDVLGRGRTGSGKTLAFGLPVVARLSGARSTANRPRALVLVPTRELAAQVNATIAPLAKVAGLSTLVITGGVSQVPQVNGLRRGIDVLIATPGRLEDLIRQGHVHLDRIETCVLDEADHMADLGFLPVVKRILDLTPKGGQRLLFSATIDASVDVLVRRYLSSPVVHSVDSAESPVPQMAHHHLTVSAEHKPAVVRELVSGRGRTIAFTRTKHGAIKLTKQLRLQGVAAVDLHGNLTQAARQRNLASFTAGTARVLVATDIAARGIHVDDVALVVHVDPPAEHKAYLHRSGRTARAGAEGVVVTVGLPHERRDVTRLMRLAAITPSTHSVEPGHDVLRTFSGPPADLVDPARALVTAPAPQPGRSGRPPRRRRSPNSR